MAESFRSRRDTEMITEPIELNYVLHRLPVGRVPFQRWRWELWHGSQLLAAGWRRNLLHAQRTLRLRALRYAHRLYGLHPLRLDAGSDREATWADGPVVIHWGDLHVVLRSRGGGQA